MSNLFSCLVILCILSNLTLQAQYKYNFNQFFSETEDFIIQPVKWESEDNLKFGVVTAGTISIMFGDEEFRDAVKRDQRYYKSFPIEFGKMWGNLYTPVAFFSGFAAYSLIADDITARKIGYEIGQTMIYAGAINLFMKIAAGRARPYNNKGAWTYRPFSGLTNDDYQSFPSGHSTVAFALSTVLSRNVSSGWLKAAIYLPAVLTATSRVYQDFHWASDVFLGAALGYYVGAWVVDNHEKPVNQHKSESTENFFQSIHFMPFINIESCGFRLSYQLY